MNVPVTFCERGLAALPVFFVAEKKWELPSMELEGIA
jgi:hypothetical protein